MEDYSKTHYISRAQLLSGEVFVCVDDDFSSETARSMKGWALLKKMHVKVLIQEGHDSHRNILQDCKYSQE